LSGKWRFFGDLCEFYGERPSQSAHLTVNHYDEVGGCGKTTLPDITAVTNEFYLTGELKKTYGSRVYPVQ
jgi:hypothetical protein